MTFEQTLHWVIANGYLIIFLAMLLEGPAITAAGAFAAKLGYFNLWFILLLSILGNLLPDIIYYAIGYWGRDKVIDKYGHYLKITKERKEQLESVYHKHMFKTLLAVKLIPLISTPGLIVAGIARLPLKKYTWMSLAIILPTSLFFLIVGYYFGAAYDTLNQYLNNGIYLGIAAAAILALIVYIYRKAAEKIGEKIEKGE